MAYLKAMLVMGCFAGCSDSADAEYPWRASAGYDAIVKVPRRAFALQCSFPKQMRREIVGEWWQRRNGGGRGFAWAADEMAAQVWSITKAKKFANRWMFAVLERPLAGWPRLDEPDISEQKELRMIALKTAREHDDFVELDLLSRLRGGGAEATRQVGRMTSPDRAIHSSAFSVPTTGLGSGRGIPRTFSASLVFSLAPSCGCR